MERPIDKYNRIHSEIFRLADNIAFFAVTIPNMRPPKEWCDDYMTLKEAEKEAWNEVLEESLGH